MSHFLKHNIGQNSFFFLNNDISEKNFLCKVALLINATLNRRDSVCLIMLNTYLRRSSRMFLLTVILCDNVMIAPFTYECNY